MPICWEQNNKILLSISEFPMQVPHIKMNLNFECTPQGVLCTSFILCPYAFSRFWYIFNKSTVNTFSEPNTYTLLRFGYLWKASAFLKMCISWLTVKWRWHNSFFPGIPVLLFLHTHYVTNPHPFIRFLSLWSPGSLLVSSVIRTSMGCQVLPSWQ